MEIIKGSKFYLCKNVEGPDEAFCPKNHLAKHYAMVFPDDSREDLLVCPECSSAFMEDEKAFRKDVR